MVVMTGWDQARSIADVLDRMATIEADLPHDDGVAYFNRMYLHVTELVDQSVDRQHYASGEFLPRLDVHFGNKFFAAYAADLEGREPSPAWAPLFDARRREHTLPIQFALAGMNAHICHDLAIAVLDTCQELGLHPEEDSAEHRDFTHVNDLLADAQEDIKGWFSTGVVAVVDEAGGRLDDGFATFCLHTARAGAWETSELLWGLSDNPGLDRMFRSGLSRSVGLTSRGILL
jgi:hypothetical protein